MPTTRAGYALSTAEQFVGLLLSALLLGVVVSKASIPSSKLVFSKAPAQNPLQSVSWNTLAQASQLVICARRGSRALGR